MKEFAVNTYFEGINNFNTAITDGKFPASASFIDVSGYAWFAFGIRAGTLDSALTCQVEQATANDGTPKDVTGAVDIVGATDDNDYLWIEVQSAQLDLDGGYRYVTLDITGAAGGNDYLDVIFYGLHAKEMPITRHANTQAPVVLAG